MDLLDQDVIYVSGGSVANLLALWRLHGLDEAFAEAWRAGVVLSGQSAGALCWHVGGNTDSFGPELRPLGRRASGCCPTPAASTTTPTRSAGRCCTSRSPTASCPRATPPTRAWRCTTSAPSSSRR